MAKVGQKITERSLTTDGNVLLSAWLLNLLCVRQLGPGMANATRNCRNLGNRQWQPERCEDDGSTMRGIMNGMLPDMLSCTRWTKVTDFMIERHLRHRKHLGDHIQVSKSWRRFGNTLSSRYFWWSLDFLCVRQLGPGTANMMRDSRNIDSYQWGQNDMRLEVWCTESKWTDSASLPDMLPCARRTRNLTISHDQDGAGPAINERKKNYMESN